jgi:hypothetical protein
MQERFLYYVAVCVCVCVCVCARARALRRVCGPDVVMDVNGTDPQRAGALSPEELKRRRQYNANPEMLQFVAYCHSDVAIYEPGSGLWRVIRVSRSSHGNSVASGDPWLLSVGTRLLERHEPIRSVTFMPDRRISQNRFQTVGLAY